MDRNAAHKRTDPRPGPHPGPRPEWYRYCRIVSDERPDEDLMAAIAGGDRAAFACLVERHLARTVGLAARLMGSRADGEEIAQEAFSRVWSHAGRWRPVGSGGNAKFTTWLYRVTVNLAIDRKRKPAFGAIEEADEPVDEADDGFERIRRREVSDAVTQALRRLPERQRVALTLCFFEGMSNIEAGNVMSLSVGAVESLLVRARRALRQELAETYEELSEG
jgi:RNA polymerase sigma-70 factor (ECF subfamily)